MLLQGECQSYMNIPGRFWQRNYYERIIRDRVELEQTRTYIRNNPLRTRDARIE